MSRLNYINYKGIKLYARNLRTEPTPSLWEFIRNRKLNGFRFLRQHPIFYRIDNDWIDYYISDFYWSKLRLIIELDGPIHELNKEKDKEHDLNLKERGYETLRIKNEELEDINVAIAIIKNFISKNHCVIQ